AAFRSPASSDCRARASNSSGAGAGEQASVISATSASNPARTDENDDPGLEDHLRRPDWNADAPAMPSVRCIHDRLSLEFAGQNLAGGVITKREQALLFPRPEVEVKGRRVASLDHNGR